MSDLRDLLQGAASSPSDDFDFKAVVGRATRRRRRRQAAFAALTTAAVVVPLWLAMSMRDSSEPTGPVATPPTSVVAPVPTTDPPTAPSTTEVPVPSSTTTVPEAPEGFKTVSFTVVDGNGSPHDHSVGVNVCDTGNPDACPWPGLDDFDGDGIVTATVKLDALYRIQGFVRADDWPGVYVDETGDGYAFSSAFEARGDELVDRTTITIPVPARIEMVVLDGDGNPLPPGIGGVMTCRADGTGACTGPNTEYRVLDDVDGDGTVILGLDPGVSWSAQGVARGAGWCSPWTDNPEGVEWHFGARLVGTPTELDGQELRVIDPCA